MITGTLIEAGDITQYGDSCTMPGIVIECTREELKAAKMMPLYRKVIVTEAPEDGAIDNINLLIGALYEIRKATARMDIDNGFAVQFIIDSTMETLSPPCDLQRWNNDYKGETI